MSEISITVQRLRRANPDLVVFGPGDPRLSRYGRIVEAPGIGELVAAADSRIPEGLEENIYRASDPELESLPEAGALGLFFGFSELQIGWNAGPNTRLNGLEWHKTSEALTAVTDLALLLGRAEDLDWRSPVGPSYDSSLVECLYLPSGFTLEIFSETMHLAPCRLAEAGFKSLVTLPRGTNEPLSAAERARAEEAAARGDGRARLLFMRNKWILAHPERRALVDRGAFPGILGRNIEVVF